MTNNGKAKIYMICVTFDYKRSKYNGLERRGVAIKKKPILTYIFFFAFMGNLQTSNLKNPTI